MVAWTVVGLSIGAAAAYAVSATLKHLSAEQAPATRELDVRALGRFVAATVTHRLWLLGIGADVVGVALQILALRVGALAVVQPLLVIGLVIALVLRARLGGRVGRREITWAVVLTASLAGLLLVADVSDRTAAAADVRPAAGVGAAGVCLAVACVALARRRHGRTGSAAAARSRGRNGRRIDRGDPEIPDPYRVAGRDGRRRQLAAVRRGRARRRRVAAQPAGLPGRPDLVRACLRSRPTDPLLSIVVGVVVFDETVRHGPAALVALLVLLATLLTAVVALTRTEPVHRSSASRTAA